MKLIMKKCQEAMEVIQCLLGILNLHKLFMTVPSIQL
ncbi:Hypothetical Protein C248_1765 [Staphylococcus aureus 08BA02176]|nr:hypothetical protein USA300HOU_1713 [Staphylococcus aureus subsp. aureus USA300_TCH1516]AFR73755.1 Hypothetical Protein C248_1765 [Staphylococcus aureus 08BA02176]EFT86625.1 hypothetical protein CGSSa03_10360 [Staphylococcus aureus subsp. aureus CGS03]EFU27531.1 hypothetical protein CGSSa01_00866 [Staphylococcus aureus subsp. aureus CGS01]